MHIFLYVNKTVLKTYGYTVNMLQIKKNKKYVVKHVNFLVQSLKTPYLCNRYPEYNLFTLKS